MHTSSSLACRQASLLLPHQWTGAGLSSGPLPGISRGFCCQCCLAVLALEGPLSTGSWVQCHPPSAQQQMLFPADSYGTWHMAPALLHTLETKWLQPFMGNMKLATSPTIQGNF